MVEASGYRDCDASCPDVDRAAAATSVVLAPALDRAVVEDGAGVVESHGGGHRGATGP